MIAPRNIPPEARKRQLEAADPDVSVFVSANAGSGKTHVLAQRVINLLLRGVDPATILCITFTKAAAANMANRVFETLAKWTALDDDSLDREIALTSSDVIDDRIRARARRLFAMALETPGGLKVQTIHAFCTRLLHQFPFEADVPARFTVMDDAATRQLLDRLTLEVLLEAAAQPAGSLGRALSDAISAAADQTFKDVIADAIARRDDLVAWCGRTGGIDAAIAELSSALGISAEETSQGIDNEYISGSAITQADWSRLAEMLASGSANDQASSARLRAAQAATGRARVESYRGVFLTNELMPRARILTKKLADAHPDWNERLHTEQRRLLGLVARERAVAARDRTRALLTIALAVIARYRSEKERRALLDYDDQIDRTLHLFRETSAAWVLYKLDAGIEHLLIDEAQDTSPKQWEIVHTIVSEFSPGGARPNVRRTMFAVGDEKQSIFSFQGAAPGQFDQMRRQFARQFDIPDMGWRYVRLEYSFRSGENILSGVDRVFRQREIFLSVTSDAAGVPQHRALPDAAPGIVELWPLTAPPERREIDGWDAPFDLAGEASPSVVLAQKIATTVKAWTARGTSPGEILILVRQRNALFEAIIRALKQAGVAVAGADRLVLTEHIAVMDLLALADALLLPDDDLALATVLKSPLFNIDEDRLFDLAWNRAGSLRAALHAKAGDDATVAAADSAFDRLGDAARRLTPFAFYAHVLGAFGGRKAFLARLGIEATDALDEFLNLALDYETRETPSLQGFVHWLRAAQSEVKRDMELARDEVRVMTVHGAKGLEARTVILADSTTTGPTGPRDPRLLTIPVKGGAAGAATIVWAAAKDNDTLAMQSARATARDAAQDEYRRLLYVAMTRAAERLVICGIRGTREPPADCWHDLVARALTSECVSEPSDDGDGEALRFYKVRPEPAAKTVRIVAPMHDVAPGPWLRRKAAAAPAPPIYLTPSETGDDGQARWSGSGDRRLALARGTLIHRLLQSLPDVPVERRADAARRFLASAGRDFSKEQRDEVAAQVMRLLDDKRFAPLFAPGSRAEVPIVGRRPRIAGQIDRLAVTAGEVLIADYKTNRPAPPSVADAVSRYPGYLRQLALYRAVLAHLYPGRRVRAALIWTDVPDFMEFSSDLLDSALAQVTSA